MTLPDFEQLNYRERIFAARQGEFIRSKTDEAKIYLLYQMNRFYIEVVFDKQQQFISALNGFEHTRLSEWHETGATIN